MSLSDKREICEGIKMKVVNNLPMEMKLNSEYKSNIYSDLHFHCKVDLIDIRRNF